MNRDKSSQLVKEISLGLMTTFTDIVLYSLYLLSFSIGKTASSRDIYKSFREADEVFSKYNTRSLINALVKLKSRKKYINFNLTTKTPIAITNSGRKRLTEIIPAYKIERPWDGKLYLISYDIPEKKRGLRDYFRSQLRLIGAGLLQDSLWLSPYNPSETLRSYIKQFSLEEWVIIAPLDKEIIHSKQNLDMLLEKVYKLSEINKLYCQFIDNVEEKRRISSAFTYFSILKKDPQLPFELEPKDFRAKEANMKFEKGVLKQ